MGLLWPPAGINKTIILAIFVMASTIGVYAIQTIVASGPPEIRLAMNNAAYCLDDKGDGLGKAGAPGTVDSWACNGSNAQHWVQSGSRITVNGQCLDVYHAGKTNGSRVDLFPCDAKNPGNQSWTYSQGSQGGTLTNNGSGKCLDAPAFKAEVPLDIYTCNGGLNQRWTKEYYTSGPTDTSGGPGVTIRNIAAQFAGRERETPLGSNAGGAVIDGANIDTFTQHHPGEPWCADFVSWVYWKGGYGFASRGGYARTPSTDGITAWFQKYGLWYPNTAYNQIHHPPLTGDFVNYRDGGHAGIVDKQPGANLTTIDGNYADGVNWDTSYNWKSGSSVSGWGRL